MMKMNKIMIIPAIPMLALTLSACDTVNIKVGIDNTATFSYTEGEEEFSTVENIEKYDKYVSVVNNGESMKVCIGDGFKETLISEDVNPNTKLNIEMPGKIVYQTGFDSTNVVGNNATITVENISPGMCLGSGDIQDVLQTGYTATETEDSDNNELSKSKDPIDNNTDDEGLGLWSKIGIGTIAFLAGFLGIFGVTRFINSRREEDEEDEYDDWR